MNNKIIIKMKKYYIYTMYYILLFMKIEIKKYQKYKYNIIKINK